MCILELNTNLCHPSFYFSLTPSNVQRWCTNFFWTYQWPSPKHLHFASMEATMMGQKILKFYIFIVLGRVGWIPSSSAFSSLSTTFSNHISYMRVIEPRALASDIFGRENNAFAAFVNTYLLEDGMEEEIKGLRYTY